MTPNDLAAIGQFLYGKRWQTALAESLCIAPRNVRHWAAGNTLPNKENQEALVRLAALHHARAAVMAAAENGAWGHAITCRPIAIGCAPQTAEAIYKSACAVLAQWGISCHA